MKLCQRSGTATSLIERIGSLFTRGRGIAIVLKGATKALDHERVDSKRSTAHRVSTTFVPAALHEVALPYSRPSARPA